MKLLLFIDNISYNKKWGTILNFIKKWFIYYLNNEIILNNIEQLKIIKLFRSRHRIITTITPQWLHHSGILKLSMVVKPHPITYNILSLGKFMARISIGKMTLVFPSPMFSCVIAPGLFMRYCVTTY